MIGKQVKGKGFRGALNYVLNPDKGILIGGNMDGTIPRALAKEFGESRKLNPGLQRPVYHVSLSLPPGERLDELTWNEVADAYMKGMGFENCQYVVSRHADRNHDHIHIVGSRIDLNGKTVSDSNDYHRSEAVIRGIEKQWGLERVLSSQEREIELQKRGLTSGELRRAIETGKPSIKMTLQNRIDEVSNYSVTMTDFVNHLRREGVQVIPNVARNGRVSGISFKVNEEIMKGSNLGKAYTFAGLQKRGISYDAERDQKAMSAVTSDNSVLNSPPLIRNDFPPPGQPGTVGKTISKIHDGVPKDIRPMRGRIRPRIRHDELER